MPVAENGNVEIYYEIIGAGEPLVMIEGLGSDHRGLKLRQVPVFRRAGYKCIILDNRGIGRSSMPDEPYTTLEMASDVACVLSAAGCSPAHVAGWSMGGAIAQHLAIQHPGCVTTLQLHCTWSRTDRYLAWQLERRRVALAKVGREELIRNLMLSTFTPNFFQNRHDEVEATVRAMIGDPSVQPEYSYLRQLDACKAHDSEPALSDIKVPTLITVGKEDPLISVRFAERLNSFLPNATLKVIEQAAHGHSIEQPEEFNAVCVEFLRSARHRQGTGHQRLQ